MLIEALRHALIRCPPDLKRLGVLHGLIAVEARHRRCGKAWRPHLETTRTAVVDMAEMLNATGTCVVVGSGSLLDVPLEELRERFSRVVLVDLFHMPKVRRAVSKMPDVHLAECDVTGLFATMERDFSRRHLSVPDAVVPEAETADLVVSVNCLSQLPLIPLMAAEAVGAGTPEQIKIFAQSIIERHLNALRSCRRAVLVTDTRRDFIDRKTGVRTDWEDLLHGAPELDLDQHRSWDWNIAPAPEESRRYDVRHRVVAGLIK